MDIKGSPVEKLFVVNDTSAPIRVMVLEKNDGLMEIVVTFNNSDVHWLVMARKDFDKHGYETSLLDANLPAQGECEYYLPDRLEKAREDARGLAMIKAALKED